MAATQGYLVKGINNQRVRLYPQVLGIHKIHEHNLCNALRDFGLMIKSDRQRQLLQYNYDFLRHVHLMRSSEICMLAHGYSLLNLKDMEWWRDFTEIVEKSIYDMDGKELAGLLYTLAKVFNNNHPLVNRLVTESTMWIEHATPSTLSLLVKVVGSLKMDKSYMARLNKRAIEIADQMKPIDVIFFLTANVEAKVLDVDLVAALCLQIVKVIEEIQLHQIRAIAASLSMGGYKSHFMFNILTVRLHQLTQQDGIQLRDSDLLSLFLAFTTQKFLYKNDLCLDPQIYRDFITKHVGKFTKKAYDYPLKILGEVLATAISQNHGTITANGMPIVIRGISILSVPVQDDLFDLLLTKTSNYIKSGDYNGLKLSNLVVSLSKFKVDNHPIWDSVAHSLDQPVIGLNGDLLAKMAITVGNCGRASLEYTQRLNAYEKLLEKSLQSAAESSIESLMSLLRLYLLNSEPIITSDLYLNALTSKIGTASINCISRLLNVYANLGTATLESTLQSDFLSSEAFQGLLRAVEDRLSHEPDVSSKKSILTLIKRFG